MATRRGVSTFSAVTHAFMSIDSRSIRNGPRDTDVTQQVVRRSDRTCRKQLCSHAVFHVVGMKRSGSVVQIPVVPTKMEPKDVLRVAMETV